MSNSLGQNPCLVSAYLSSVCNSGTWFVPTLVGEGPYNPPDGTGVTTCRCNTVVYNLLQACSDCQGGLIDTWADWITYCPSGYVEKTYPNTVPTQTTVPGWASGIDPTITGTWNATAAQVYAASHVSSPASTSTSGSKKKSNAGAIAGGVVGGIVGLALIGVLVWFFLQRSSRGKGLKVTPAPYTDPGLNAGYMEKDGHERADMGSAAPMMDSGMPLKPYDPEDPSTFPTASPAPTATTYIGQDHSMSGISQQGYPGYSMGSPDPHSHGSPPPHQPGMYTGAAEV